MSRSDALNLPHTRADAPPLCAHCGLKVPPNLIREGDAHQFCCNGCRQVYHLLHEVGATDYYELRKQEGASGQPAKVSGRSFNDFDNDVFQTTYVADTERATKQTELYLEGVHCAACVWLVENIAGKQPGVVSLRLDLPRSKAVVEWDPSAAPLSQIAHSLDALGYTPHAFRADQLAALHKREDRALLIKLGLAAACAINIMVIQAALYAGEHQGIEPRFEQFFRWISFLLALPVAGFSARPFFKAAWAGLKERVPHMDLPISIAIIASFSYSTVSTLRGTGHIYFDSIAALVALLLAGRYVQSRAQRAAMDLAERMRGTTLADFARKRNAAGELDDVPIEAIAPGDEIVIRSGDTIPADGVVLHGRSSVNNAVLSGESTPLTIGPGDPVNAGATNVGAQISVRVDAVGEKTRVGGLMKLVDVAASSRAPIVQLADRISRKFVVVVLSLALATAISWYLIDPDTALEHVIALLVVTCPCALGLATPVAVSVSLSKAARHGIYIKHADTIERMQKIKTVFLDKTGTLTAGDMRVVDFTGDPALGRAVAALEAQSGHPIAAALLRHFGDDIGSLRVERVREVSGQGIAGRVDGMDLAVGSHTFMVANQIAIAPDIQARAAEMTEQGTSPIYVAKNGRLAALFGLGDPLRPEARAILDEMRRMGWQPQLLSGDHPGVVARVADELGIPRELAHGGVTPEAKYEMVKAHLENRSDPDAGLLMLGDGVNDAAALALADVGVAMHGGAGASALAADVVLTRNGLMPLVALAHGSRRTMHVIYRNLGFSLLYNLSGASLAMLGLVGPLVAAILMPISSLTVILSSVLGRRYRDLRQRTHPTEAGS